MDHEWGDYYLSGKRKGGKKNWLLEAVYQINQMIPSFSEIFDQVGLLRFIHIYEHNHFRRHFMCLSF